MNYESPQEIREILRRQGIALKKRWGQNFLINRGAREKISALIDAGETETVWEIGPGLGALTVLLLPAAGKLIAFEIDRGLVRWLTEEFSGNTTFSVCQGDVLKTWPRIYETQGKPQKVCGNLPYRSASAIILSFIMAEVMPSRMVFTVQRELALRMSASPGSKNYSGFSVLCQSMFALEPGGELKPGSFYPEPDVRSSIVVFTPCVRWQGAFPREWFLRLVRIGFASRRKTFKNNILQTPDLNPVEKQRVLAVLEQNYSVERLRAEELSVDQFIELARKCGR